MDVRVEGQMVDAPAGADLAAVLRQALSGRKFKAVVAARAEANGESLLLDLSASLPDGCTELIPVYADSPGRSALDPSFHGACAGRGGSSVSFPKPK